MKKVCTILCSTIGGAILGSALTIFLTPKTGEQMRQEVQDMVIEQIQRLQNQIKSCECMMGGECSSESKGNE